MGEDQMPVIDPERAHPVAPIWRPTLRSIVSRIVHGDYELQGLKGVAPLAREEGEDRLRDRVVDYAAHSIGLSESGVRLVELPEETWQTSESISRGSDLWDVMVDLYTAEEGRSDLVLSVRISESESGFEYEIHMIYVP